MILLLLLLYVVKNSNNLLFNNYFENWMLKTVFVEADPSCSPWFLYLVDKDSRLEDRICVLYTQPS